MTRAGHEVIENTLYGPISTDDLQRMCILARCMVNCLSCFLLVTPVAGVLLIGLAYWEGVESCLLTRLVDQGLELVVGVLVTWPVSLDLS